MAPASSKEFLDIQATVERGFTLKLVRDMIKTYNQIDDVYENLEDYNPTKKKMVTMVFDDMITDMKANKKIKFHSHSIVLKTKKLNISLAFASQPHFKVPKKHKTKRTHCFILKQIGSNHLSDINFKDFMKLFMDYTKRPFSFAVNDTILPSIIH